METINPIPDVEKVSDTRYDIYYKGFIYRAKFEGFAWNLFLGDRKEEDLPLKQIHSISADNFSDPDEAFKAVIEYISNQ